MFIAYDVEYFDADHHIYFPHLFRGMEYIIGIESLNLLKELGEDFLRYYFSLEILMEYPDLIPIFALGYSLSDWIATVSLRMYLDLLCWLINFSTFPYAITHLHAFFPISSQDILSYIAYNYLFLSALAVRYSLL